MGKYRLILKRKKYAICWCHLIEFLLSLDPYPLQWDFAALSINKWIFLYSWNLGWLVSCFGQRGSKCDRVETWSILAHWSCILLLLLELCHHMKKRELAGLLWRPIAPAAPLTACQVPHAEWGQAGSTSLQVTHQLMTDTGESPAEMGQTSLNQNCPVDHRLVSQILWLLLYVNLPFPRGKTHSRPAAGQDCNFTLEVLGAWISGGWEARPTEVPSEWAMTLPAQDKNATTMPSPQMPQSIHV